MTSTAKDYWLYSTVKTAFKDTIKAGGTKTYTIQATGAYSPTVDALETGGNFGISDAVAIYAPDGVGETEWTDASGNGYHGVVNGAVRTADIFGRETKAYSFDDASIDMPSLPIEDTFEYIIQSRQNSGQTATLGCIVDTNVSETVGYNIYHTSSGTIRAQLRSEISSTIIINDIENTEDTVITTSLSRENGTFVLAVDDRDYSTEDIFSGDVITIFTVGKQANYSTYNYMGELYLCAVYSRRLNANERTAIREYRKYAPNLVVSSFTDLGSGLYQFTVENTGATDYIDVQIPLDVTILGLTSTSDSVEILNVTPIVIDFDTTPLYVNYNESVTLNATITSDHPISKIEVYQNDVKVGEMRQV